MCLEVTFAVKVDSIVWGSAGENEERINTQNNKKDKSRKRLKGRAVRLCKFVLLPLMCKMNFLKFAEFIKFVALHTFFLLVVHWYRSLTKFFFFCPQNLIYWELQNITFFVQVRQQVKTNRQTEKETNT